MSFLANHDAIRSFAGTVGGLTAAANQYRDTDQAAAARVDATY